MGIGDYHVDFNCRLGQGSYGCVFKGSHSVTGNVVAVKQVEKAEHLNVSTYQEIESLKSIEHDNIVKLLAVSHDEEYTYIVLEYCDQGDLDGYMKKNRLTLPEKVQIMYQSACAVSYLHNQTPCIVHRDIKLNNILVTNTAKGTIVKVCDFGLSKILDGDNFYMETDTGAVAFRAPELLQKKGDKYQYTASVDVFALGMVFKIMLDHGSESQDLKPKEVAIVGEDKWMMTYAMSLQKAKDANKRCPALFVIRDEDSSLLLQLKILVTNMTACQSEERPDMGHVKRFLEIFHQKKSHVNYTQELLQLHERGEQFSGENARLKESVKLLQAERDELKELITRHVLDKYEFKGQLRNANRVTVKMKQENDELTEALRRVREEKERLQKRLEQQSQDYEERTRKLEDKLQKVSKHFISKNEELDQSFTESQTALTEQQIRYDELSEEHRKMQDKYVDFFITRQAVEIDRFHELEATIDVLEKSLYPDVGSNLFDFFKDALDKWIYKKQNEWIEHRQREMLSVNENKEALMIEIMKPLKVEGINVHYEGRNTEQGENKLSSEQHNKGGASTGSQVGKSRSRNIRSNRYHMGSRATQLPVDLPRPIECASRPAKPVSVSESSHHQRQGPRSLPLKNKRGIHGATMSKGNSEEITHTQGKGKCE